MAPVERDWLERALAPLRDAVLVIGEGRRVLWCNEAIRDLLGWEPEELIGGTTERLHEDAAAHRRFGEIGEPVLLRDGIFHVRWRLRRRDGELLETSQTVALIEPSGGLAAGALSIIRDLTQATTSARQWFATRHAEEALDLADVAHAVHADDGFLSANGAAVALLGGSEAGMKGRHLAELLADEDRERIRVALRDALEDGRPFGPFDLRLRAGGWSRPSVRVFGLAPSVGGAKVLLLFEPLAPPVVAASAREQSHRFFRNLIDSTLDIVTVLDREGRIVFENQAVQEALGHRVDERIGRQAFEWVHPEDRPTAEQLFLEGRDVPERRLRVRLRLRHADGRWRVFEVAARNLLHDGHIEGVVASARDVTERVEAEAGLLETRRRLQQAEKMEAIGRLAGGVAHDFNNMLTVIHSYAELLRPALAGQPTGEADLGEILRAAERARELVRRLLDIGQRGRGRNERVRLAGLLADLGPILRRLVGERIDLRVEIEDEELSVLADPTQLERVLVNLVVNARDAMPEGGLLEIRVDRREETVTGGEETRDGGVESFARIRVRDEGVGMDEAVRARLFEPFFTTKGEKGSGLGLSITWGIVQQAGGRLECESEPGRGSTFTAWWPAEPD